MHLVLRTACIDERTYYLRSSERIDLQKNKNRPMSYNPVQFEILTESTQHLLYIHFNVLHHSLAV
jgi:hypothetical protein